MSTEINQIQSLEKMQNAKFGTPSYYFHPDEDFREDFDWGKGSDNDVEDLEA
ncbi:hypothetical protein SAMN06265348_102459 [Pedobacter westerhofensis]|uniref:Uncharacterized protein n=1 Tax=Pedobacter westerhofensis TaxID=425512 RepID=A0A521BQL2_9SPHI|nr:hypothetical protein [Pedobacter westerhofensis]SMO48840.1 hypothetical protein SAMN06265348_102459 [Pedobacter westerhofensis]